MSGQAREGDSVPVDLPSPAPTVGRIVHYTTMGATEPAYAAIIVNVHEHGVVDLQVFGRIGSGSMLARRVPHLWASTSGLSTDGRWTYPPRT